MLGLEQVRSSEVNKGREWEREATKIEQLRARGEGGFKFWSFCDNVILECP